VSAHTWPGRSQRPGCCLRRTWVWTGVRRLSHAGHQRGHGYSLPQTPRTWQLMRCVAEPVWDHCHHRSQTVPVSMVKVGRHDHRPSVLDRSGSAPPDTYPVAVWDAGQVLDTRDGRPRPLSVRRLRVLGERSSGRRPLVGCSQRRWMRASRAVRRPRSRPALPAGRSAAAASARCYGPETASLAALAGRGSTGDARPTRDCPLTDLTDVRLRASAAGYRSG
jgi:hypothetical protein